ncbi:hydrogenase maturation protease [Abyssisolibacter fermentans]|uniref:hydrogenase maturation protease n=1 Tax=Abyssisolibacter fermentans TaxID=1766203 RepID=UPI000834157B|nr:hydrogenase maturation protease [Abyssisolibacter fermentans]
MIKVIGIGNRVMSDDGIAIHVLEKIKDEIKMISPEIEVIIGETDFVYCLNKINNNDYVIIVDSTFLGLESGKVTLLSFNSIAQYKNFSFTQHDASLINRILNYKSSVKGCIIGIEIYSADYGFDISNILRKRFKNICKDTLYQIKTVIYKGGREI